LTLLVDSSVWVDYLRGTQSPAAKALNAAIGKHSILLGDLILAEVLRGVSNEPQAQLVTSAFEQFDVVHIGGKDLAIAAAAHYRILRQKGITVRGTIDLLVATWCIRNDVPLLHSDRDFDGMERWLGLKLWRG
jgi:hypothetical protein